MTKSAAHAAREPSRQTQARPSPSPAQSNGRSERAKPLRILHVDDEPDLREIVAMALGLDPEIAVESCASGADALMAAADAIPDLVLLDVMMPEMDGPSTLAHLREDPRLAEVPAVFMTARAQKHEIERFMALGAMGVIPKPFDPMTLASQVRRYLQAAHMAPLRAKFVRRACRDAAALVALRHPPAGGDTRGPATHIRNIAHGLAGAAGLYGFTAIAAAAAKLESEAHERLAGAATDARLEPALDALLALLMPLADAELAHLANGKGAAAGRPPEPAHADVGGDPGGIPPNPAVTIRR